MAQNHWRAEAELIAGVQNRRSKVKPKVGSRLMEKDTRQLQLPALLMLVDGCLKYLQPMG